MVVGAPYSVTACPAAAGSATASYSVCRQMWCFFGALIPLTAATVASPALQALVSKQVYAGDQAKLQGDYPFDSL